MTAQETKFVHLKQLTEQYHDELSNKQFVDHYFCDYIHGIGARYNVMISSSIFTPFNQDKRRVIAVDLRILRDVHEDNSLGSENLKVKVVAKAVEDRLDHLKTLRQFVLKSEDADVPIDPRQSLIKSYENMLQNKRFSAAIVFLMVFNEDR